MHSYIRSRGVHRHILHTHRGVLPVHLAVVGRVQCVPYAGRYGRANKSRALQKPHVVCRRQNSGRTLINEDVHEGILSR